MGSLPTSTRFLSPKASHSIILLVTSSLKASSPGVIMNANPASCGIEFALSVVLVNDLSAKILLK